MKLQTKDTFDSWDDLVFENRNQHYGAYPLRKNYFSNVLSGVILTMAFLAFILALPAISRLLADDKIVKAPPKKLVYTELMAPPPIDRPKPPPPNIALPKLQKVIKFVPPNVVKEEVASIVPTIEELKVNEVAATEIDGATDVDFDDPVESVVTEGDSDEIFMVVEQQPEFAGGYDALANYLRANMQYPKLARKMGIEGTVHVSFLVSKTGAISDVKVLRGILAECDKEAIRVVEKMPTWKPGLQNGHPVHVRLVMPLKFRLN
jgi:periplasmic protein TonB